MGRPKGSKNKKKDPKKLKVVRDKTPKIEEQKVSFSCEAITCLDETFWAIRKELEKLAIEIAKNNNSLQCIPVEHIEYAFIKLGLEKFVAAP